MTRNFFIIIFLAITLQVSAQGYKIEVKINNLPNQELILGHHRSDRLVPDDTVVTNAQGYAVFSGKKELAQGLYFIFLPSKTYFDFIIGDDQFFKIENDTTDFINNFKSKGSVENELFGKYQIFMTEQSQKMRQLQSQLKAEKDPAKKAEIENQIKSISKEYDKKYEYVQTNYPSSFFALFLKAAKEVSIPDEITDNYKKYLYYKNHYFDNFDLSDARLLNTPFFDNKIQFYLDKLVPMVPDSINAACDEILEKTKGDSTTYQYVLVYMFNKYAKSNLMIAENIYSHLVDIYVKKAYWAPDSFKNEIQTKNVRKKQCLIGNKAKDLHMTMLPDDTTAIEALRIPLEEIKSRGLAIEKDTSRSFDDKLPDLSGLVSEYMAYFPNDIQLYSTNHKYTILWFMSPTCSHCIHDTPLFFDQLNKELKDVDVVVWSIFLESSLDNWWKFCHEINEWYDFVEKHNLHSDKWINLWNPFDNYRFKYDISASPVLYLLDKDKKIVAKKIGYEQAIEIIKEIESKGEE